MDTMSVMPHAGDGMLGNHGMHLINVFPLEATLLNGQPWEKILLRRPYQLSRYGPTPMRRHEQVNFTLFEAE